ncbi:energy-coupling factor ABC transporter ATP-binding protein [Facklamia sp. 7083-14-GEN3]|uniref:energy-coupling factor ABC transporter ATP-binding protein n=1 Tax=Facklamia sp. 7083-14-GEN3 TaxID=2973478 RepID=UPI00215C223D|nr:energy-coupling factor ABC transporter ATP-binding protein [Facklamia sp. 7083-14-GEN3]MCR8969719.1 energy-coupling factor ABC transporter ATP-binding protein [Facklamia sp. 7083-14-GEN3]
MKEEIIRIDSVSFQYPGAEKDAIKDISLSINKGEWVALIGPNGSGKSTLSKTINGLLVPYEGEIYVKGMKLQEETVWDVRRAVGRVFQNPDNQFVGATVEDDVAFGLENNGISREEMKVRVKEAVQQVRMLDFLKKEPARLSGGQKQRVAIAGVVALRPDIIIMDESTAMLDPLGRKEVVEVVREIKEKYGLTVISITHDIDEASLADQIIVLKEGKVIYKDIPANIFSMGSSLIEIGLDLPFAEKLRLQLKEKGISVPDRYLTEEEMAEWLSQSYLNK